MPVVQVEVGNGQVVELETEATPEQLEQFLATPEGQDMLRSELQAANPREDFAGNVEAAQAEAQQDIEEDLGPVDRTLIGAGKVANDIQQGVAQIFLQATGDQERAADIGAQLSRERDTFKAFDEKQLGAEDLGEILGDAAALIPAGVAGIGIKGGAIAGAMLEGLKGQETTEMGARLKSAGVGAAAGAAGAALGQIVTGLRQSLTPGAKAAQEAMGFGVNKDALKSIAIAGTLKLTGMSPLSTSTMLLSGIRNLSSKAGATAQAKSFLNARARELTSAEEKRLVAKRVGELEKFQEQAYDQLSKVVNQMSNAGRKGVLSEETGLTLKTLVEQSRRTLPNGQVGVDPADIIKGMPLMSEQALVGRLGKAAGEQVNGLKQVWKEQSGQILTPEQVQAQVIQYNKVMTDELLPLLSKPNLTKAEKAAKSTLMESIISRGVALEGIGGE